MGEPAILSDMQRAQGVAHLGLRSRPGGAAVVARLFQSGAAKVILPRVPGRTEAVFLNTAGGLTGGDRLDLSLALGPGVSATATTQTAERAYRAESGTAEMRIRAEVGPGATLHWLPQETILYDGASLTRRTEIRLDPAAAGCIALETLVLGRAAMGESLRRVTLRDHREIWQDGRLVFADPLRLDSADLASGPAGLGGARALASLVLLGSGVADALGPLRARLDEPGVLAAASALPGRLILRARAVDGWPLRRLLARVLAYLTGGPLPRVWQM